jgi:two-component system, cell cycle sensor histidine kinase and response regulator CckA
MEVLPIKRAPGQSHSDAVKDQLHPDDSPRMDRTTKEALRSGHSFYAQDYRCMGNDGQWHHLHEEVRVEVVGAKCWRLVGVCTNISDRVHMEEEMRKNQNLESLGVLAGGIAHDFNNALTGVIGSLTLLEMLVARDSDAYQIAKDGKRAADRTRDMTHQLLTFAKGGTPVKEVASIEALIRETTTLSLHGSNTKPEYHLAEDLHSVNLDQGQIGQVIQNLILNADQAMPGGGTLKVLAENVEIFTQDSRPIAAGEYVKVSVVDQGFGMSKEVMAKIFDPYFSTKTAGHGLGLSITHSIIQKHGGHIAVHSEQNVGTTFEFYLPALQEIAPTTTEQSQELARGTGRILLMDDDEMTQIAVKAMLEALGYEVEVVYDGAAALQAYQAARETTRPFDGVIMDLTIPGGMGGQEAVGKLHEMDPKARVIVSSGYANDPILTQFSEYGFAGKVRKPVNIQELAETVKRVLADET